MCRGYKQNASINAENSLGTSAEDVAKNNLKAVQPNGFKAVVGAVNAFSVLDNVCMIPTMANAIGMGAEGYSVSTRNSLCNDVSGSRKYD